MQGIGLIRLKILEVPCECGIEPPGCISHGVRDALTTEAVSLFCGAKYRLRFVLMREVLPLAEQHCSN